MIAQGKGRKSFSPAEVAPVFVGAAPRREGLRNAAEARTMRDFERHAAIHAVGLPRAPKWRAARPDKADFCMRRAGAALE